MTNEAQKIGAKTQQKAWLLTTYTHSSYSYSGIDVRESFFHLSGDGAINHAHELGLNIINECQNPEKHCTIEEVPVYS